MIEFNVNYSMTIDRFDWHRRMQHSTDYLPIGQMQAGMAYSIWARNAYTGIWIPEERGFLISRYKIQLTPYLFVEFHWDTGEPFGTVKPLRPIGICPSPLPPRSAYHEYEQGESLCAWLDALEQQYPPLPGWDAIGERRQSVAGRR